MALIKCIDCGAEVSTKASECKQCGAKIVSLGGKQWDEMSGEEKVGAHLGFVFLSLVVATIMIWFVDWVIPSGSTFEKLFNEKYYWWFFGSFFLTVWGTIAGWFHRGEMNT